MGADVQDAIVQELVAARSSKREEAQQLVSMFEDDHFARGTNCWTSTPRNYWTTLNPFQTRQNTTIIKV